MKKGYDLTALFPATEREVVAAQDAERTGLSEARAAVSEEDGKSTKKVTYELRTALVERMNAFVSAHAMKKLAFIERAVEEYLTKHGG